MLSAGLSRGPGTAQREKGTPAPSSCPVNRALSSTMPGLGRACRRIRVSAKPQPAGPARQGPRVCSLRRLPCQWHLCLRDAPPSEARHWQRGSGESPAPGAGSPSQVTHARRELTSSLLVHHGGRLHAGADLRAGGLLGAPQRSARALSRLSPPSTHPPGGPLVSVPKPTTRRLPGGSSAGLVHARPRFYRAPRV